VGGGEKQLREEDDGGEEKRRREGITLPNNRLKKGERKGERGEGKRLYSAV